MPLQSLEFHQNLSALRASLLEKERINPVWSLSLLWCKRPLVPLQALEFHENLSPDKSGSLLKKEREAN